jgi:hypothetical protein
VPPAARSRARRPRRRSPSPHSSDDQPRQPRVDEDVAHAHGLTDRLRDGDDVGEEGELILIGQQVVLLLWLVPQRGEHGLLARVDQGLRARRHAPVHQDHGHVAGQSDHHQGHARHPNVDQAERQQKRVRQREHRGSDREVDADDTLGQRDELDAESQEDEPPPPGSERFEAVHPPTEEVPEADGQHEDGEQELHR